MSAQQPTQPIRLYGVELSGHCHRVRLFLEMLKLPYEFVQVNLAAAENRKSEFLSISPFGQVPVLEDGATVLYDSNAILVYLARQYGEPRWLPTDPAGAAHVQQWLSLAAGQIAYGPCAARLVKLFGAQLEYDTAVKIADRLFAVLEPLMAARTFAVGAQPTIADIAAYSYIAHAPEGGISLDPYPNMRAWLRRVEALPGFIDMPWSHATA